MAQAQQISPNQVKGLKESLQQLDSLVPIKKLGDNLELESDGTLIVTGVPDAGDESSGDIGEITPDDATKVSHLPDNTLYDVVSEASISDTEIEYTIKAKNLKTGATSTKRLIVPVATDKAIGLMSVEDKQKLTDLPEIKKIDESLTLESDGTLSVTKTAPDLNLVDEFDSDPASDALYTATYINSKFDEVGSETTSKITKLEDDVNTKIGDIKSILDAIDVGDGGTGEGTGGETIDLTELKEKLVALNSGIGA